MTQTDTRMNFYCVDCSHDTLQNEYYMVRHEIWKEYGAGKRMLCVGCLEMRMGRRLTPPDFLDAPINYMSISSKSPRLVNRLFSTPSPVL